MTSRKALIIAWAVVAVAVCGLGFTTFMMINATKSISDKNAKITAQQKEIAALDKKVVAAGTEVPTKPVDAEVKKTDEFTIPELGVAFTLPPELKSDVVTYVYSYDKSSGTSNVAFSSKALIDKDKMCGFDGTLGAFGILSKRAGQQTGPMASAVVVKQYPSYHLIFAGPHAPCGGIDASQIPHQQLFESLKASIYEVK